MPRTLPSNHLQGPCTPSSLPLPALPKSPTMSLSQDHQLSNPSSRESSGTRSSSTRSVLTLSRHRLELIAKSRSVEKWLKRGWSERIGMRAWERSWRYGEGCFDRVSRKNADAFERPRRVALEEHRMSKRSASSNIVGTHLAKYDQYDSSSHGLSSVAKCFPSSVEGSTKCVLSQSSRSSPAGAPSKPGSGTYRTVKSERQV